MGQLTAEKWKDIFTEAKDLGISFILLAGGEPTMRRDVIEMAGNIPEIIFPIFTNGTLLDEQYYEMFNEHRNLIPILSIEGKEENTDERRGPGTFAKLTEEMDRIKAHGLIFGASVTVTTKNIKEVTSNDFLSGLAEKGCKAVIFVEYVPVDDMNIDQAPGDAEREYMKKRLADLRTDYADNMIMISFPGDEKSSGGCLAAGRGFFHINSHGDAEPCPFSPYSDINVKDTSLREVLKSGLFKEIGAQGLLAEEHAGGCILYERRKSVEKLLKG
jgi:MoaA/NifB/PqqE/SkfB family radical SAM enzyme